MSSKSPRLSLKFLTLAALAGAGCSSPETTQKEAAQVRSKYESKAAQAGMRRGQTDRAANDPHVTGPAR